MLTIFSHTKPFKDSIGTNQRNAIQSWCALGPGVEVILYGTAHGTAKAAASFNARHIPDVQKSPYGGALVDWLFENTRKVAINPYLVFANADIILMHGFYNALRNVAEEFQGRDFVMVGRRIDLDVIKLINTSSSDWEKQLEGDIDGKGVLHGYSGIDFFAFPKSFNPKLRPFVIGRSAWDNWFLHSILQREIPLIDVTAVVKAVHQNHPSNYTEKDIQSRMNLKIAGGYGNLASLRNASYLLTTDGIQRPPLIRRLLSRILRMLIFRYLIILKRKANLYLTN